MVGQENQFPMLLHARIEDYNNISDITYATGAQQLVF